MKLADVDDAEIYEALKEIMPDAMEMLEIMFSNNVGLSRIESMINEAAAPKEVRDSVIRAFRWKYIDLMDSKKES